MIQHPLALKIQDSVNDVLERLWPRDAALTRDVPHNKHRYAGLFRKPHQAGGTFSHLPDTSRRAIEICSENSLNRVDHEHRWLHRCRSGNDGLQQCLAKQVDFDCIRAESLCAQSHLQR